MSRVVSTLPLLAWLLITPARANAQQAAADALFDSARSALSRGDFGTACEQFRASDLLDPALGTELNLADCEEKRGHLASAWELFRTVAEKLTEADERLSVAQARAQALAPRVPRLVLKLAASAPRSSTVRDGKVEIGSAAFGVPLPMDPGPHDLVVSAPGFRSRTISIRLAEGEVRSLSVGPGDPLPAGAPAKAPAKAPLTVVARQRAQDARASSGSQRSLGFALSGVGLVGVSVAAITGVAVLGKRSDVDSGCSPDKSCTSAGLAASRSGRTLEAVSNVSWLIGAAGLASGAYFLLSSGPSSKPNTSLTVAPRLAGGQLSLIRTW